MDKEILEKLREVLKETSPQDLWEQLKKIEEAIGGSLDQVENMEDLLVSMIAEEAAEVEEKSYAEVAKAKGLPEPEGDLVKKFYGLNISRGPLPAEAETKGVKSKKKAEDYHPTDEELLQINSLSNIDLKKENLYVFTLTSADEEVDRSSDQFSTKALKDMAEMSPDKPFLRDHSWGTNAVIGKIFDAKVSNKKLIQKVYMPVSAKNIDMIDGILNGIHNKVSVGFAMDPKDYVCSSCSKSVYSMECAHYPGHTDAQGKMVVGLIKGVKDYYEISNVAIPAQRNAGIRRSNEKSLESGILSDEEYELYVKGIESTEKESLDKILTDVSSPNGDAPVEDNKTVETKEEVIETKEVEAPPAEVSKEAPEAPIAKAVDVEAMVKAALAPELESLKALIADLKETLAAKAEVEKSVEDESTEEIVRKAAATTIAASEETSNEAPVVDLTKSGWILGLGNALKPRDSQ